jgi:hypothetical protein
MTHIYWVPRQNKQEIPRDKDEVNKREIHECDGRAHDPDTMDIGAVEGDKIFSAPFAFFFPCLLFFDFQLRMEQHFGKSTLHGAAFC